MPAETLNAKKRLTILFAYAILTSY